MADYYVDSSALVKRHVPEIGSACSGVIVPSGDTSLLA